MGSGIRECYVAREGWALTSVDFPALEMITLAQVLFWRYGPNAMQAAINRDDDLHCRLVAEMVGKPYDGIVAVKKKDPYIANLRQAGKAGNFGFAGGMGPVKFVISKRKDKSDEFPNGIRFCELLGRQKKCGETPMEVEWRGNKYSPFCPVCAVCAVEIREAYLKAWPEMVQFFRDCSTETSQHEHGGWLTIPGTNVIRGPLTYTSYANGHFQGLAAVGAKRALWEVTKASYVDKKSPLYRVCRPVAFIHDEILAEIWIPALHEAAWEMTRIMRETMQAITPDVLVSKKMEPAAATRWFKAMEYVKGPDGKMALWGPKKAA